MTIASIQGLVRPHMLRKIVTPKHFVTRNALIRGIVGAATTFGHATLK